MQVILLSGGSGKRLWPLSNGVRSKQFLKIFAGENGEPESMVQRMYRGFKMAAPDMGITVTTLKAQASQLINQLGERVDLCVEPVRRDTFPAVALASLYLRDEKKLSPDEPVIVCPVDPYVGDDYFYRIRDMADTVANGTNRLVLMGIRPTYPSEKYGYILTDSEMKVVSFKEKPGLSEAEELLRSGAWWNGGIFGFRLGYMLKIAKERTGFDTFAELKDNYESLKAISFDYEVTERETDIGMVPFYGEWKDIGTWNTFSEVMAGHTSGKVKTDETCENTHIVNELDVPLLAMGLKDMVVAASSDGILIADKGRSSHMKPFVDEIAEPVKFAEKSWGSYQVLDVENTGMTVKVTLLPDHAMNYHSHERRDEMWTVIKGEGICTIDGEERRVGRGDVVMLPAGCKHTVRAITTLVIMEIQFGEDIDVADKIKY